MLDFESVWNETTLLEHPKGIISGKFGEFTCNSTEEKVYNRLANQRPGQPSSIFNHKHNPYLNINVTHIYKCVCVCLYSSSWHQEFNNTIFFLQEIFRTWSTPWKCWYICCLGHYWWSYLVTQSPHGIFWWSCY